MTNTRVLWLGPDDPDNAFPSVEQALCDPEGLLAAGGDLGTSRLLYAYCHGIFPWYDEGQPILWWSPNPRCIFQKGDFHVSRRLRRELRGSTSEIRFNTAFGDVIRACAGPRRSEQGTWITTDMIRAFEALHEQGWAHSVEVWQDDELIGGLYGLAIGRGFFGESMFSSKTNASKLALLTIVQMMDRGEFEIVDCQVPSSHLLGLGARLVSREDFVGILESLCDPEIRFENWPNVPISACELLPD